MPAAATGQGTRFSRRRQAVLNATAGLINRAGLGDTTLAAVAAEIGLNLKSLRYYFERREDLIVATYRHSLTLHCELVSVASSQSTVQARVESLVKGYFSLLGRVARCEQPQFAYFSDLRALSEAEAEIIYPEYVAFFRMVRSLLGPIPAKGERGARNARTHLLISQLFWSAAWIGAYVPEDFERVADRFTDILLQGLAAAPLDLRPAGSAKDGVEGGGPGLLSEDDFLRAATTLINEQGYRGAAVERIAASLNVSRGAFYHRYEARHDLVAACFESTFALLRQAQTDAMAQCGAGLSQLARAVVDLVSRQLSAEGVMLRTTALTVLEPGLRQEMTLRMSRVTSRFADMLNDGFVDGSVRPCDVRIGAEMVTATINSATELRRWAPDITGTEVADLYVRPLLEGFFTPSTSPGPG